LAADERSVHFQIYSPSSEQIIEILRSFVPADKRPTTHRQQSYASTIASRLGIAAPEAVLRDARACSSFIDEHKKKFDEIKARDDLLKEVRRELAAKANRIHRWTAAQSSLTKGTPITQVAQQFDVSPPTIEKYCVLLEEWKLEDKSTEENQIVLKLIERIEAGENPWEVAKTVVT
jgi:predicted trehalose synthase